MYIFQGCIFSQNDLKQLDVLSPLLFSILQNMPLGDPREPGRSGIGGDISASALF
jgi:hypothetical protein